VCVILALLALEIHDRILPPILRKLATAILRYEAFFIEAHASISAPSAAKWSLEVSFRHFA
jgi:hypothetical protein